MNTKSFPTAIVGAACRLPGGVRDLQSYWALLSAGSVVIREIPRDRFDVDALFDKHPEAPGKMWSRWGGFLEDVWRFEPSFFGISHREAAAMDPQQRMLLELTWECLEQAAVHPQKFRGSRTGVFVGTSANDFPLVRLRALETVDAFASAGMHPAVLANRVAHVYDLHGPNMTVDTACASGLTAVHLALSSLRRGECNWAFAAGVNLNLHELPFVGTAKGRMTSPTGRARVFDHQADGYVRGEGCGMVLLQPLDAALAMGTPILGVLVGSAVGQDGHTKGISAPNPKIQAQMYRMALEEADLSPDDITLIECHGTGTQAGDAAELTSIREVYGAGKNACALGSAKALLGHLEGAAGMAGLLKVLACMQHAAVPPQPSYERLQPGLSLENTRLSIHTQPVVWKGEPKRAAVSAFGFGGALAHVIVTEPPTRTMPESPAFEGGALLFSAHSAEALKTRAVALSKWLRETDESPANGQEKPTDADIAWTSGVLREPLRHRGAVVGRGAKEWAAALETWAENIPAPIESGGLAFVYSGQGPQWWAMGRELLEHDPIFRNAVEQCDAILRSFGGESVLAALTETEERSRLSETWFAQPALVALEVGLTERLRAWGIQPTAVLGHSLGEVVSAWAAGALSLEEALHVVHYRVRMQDQTDRGAMAAVHLPHDQADAWVAPYGDRLTVAAYNGPNDVALSGEPEALEDVLIQLEQRGIHVKRMPVRYAFHSAQMEGSSRQLARYLKEFKAAEPQIAAYASVHGDRARPGDFGGEYHARNVRQPVRFAQAAAAMVRDGVRIFVEISPHPVLSGYLEATLRQAGARGLAIGTLRRRQPERAALQQVFASLWTAGLDLDPAKVLPPARLAPIPTAVPIGSELRLPEAPRRRGPVFQASPHPLLSTPVAEVNPDGTLRRRWTIRLSAQGFHQLQDHRVSGRIVFPGAATVDIFFAAAHDGLEGAWDIEELELPTPVIVPEQGEIEVQLVGHPELDGSVKFALATPEVEASRVHARARMRRQTSPGAQSVALDEIRARCLEMGDVGRHIAKMNAVGLDYGPAFAPLRSVFVGRGEALAQLEAPEIVERESLQCFVHPGLLDAAFQLLAFTHGDASGTTWLPASIARVHARVTRGRVARWAWLRNTPSTVPDERRADLMLLSEQGEVLVEVNGFRIRRVADARPDHLDQLLHVQWIVQQNEIESQLEARGPRLVLVDDESAVPEALVAHLGGADVVAVKRWSTLETFPDALEAVIFVATSLTENSFVTTDHEGQAISVMLQAALHSAHQLAIRPNPPRLWLVTRRCQRIEKESVDPRGAGLWGLGRTIHQEMPALGGGLVDLDACDDVEFAQLGAIVQSGRDGVQVAIRGALRYEASLDKLSPPRPTAKPAAGRPYALMRDGSGQLERLQFQARVMPPLGPDDVEIAVEAAGLNFLDVLSTLELIPRSLLGPSWGKENLVGMEGAGRVVAVGSAVQGLSVGDHVMGLLAGSFAPRARTRSGLVTRFPASLSWSEAAGIPLAFLTAWESLIRVAKLARGERVLIHAGLGGVGMAAIQIARHVGATIFATAGTEKRRKQLLEFGVDVALDSRSTSFVQGILEHTHGEGVDVVLNSLSEPYLSASFGVLRPEGRFVDIGKRDFLADRPLGLKPFLKRLSFSLVDLLPIVNYEPKRIRALYAEFLPLFESGVLGPLPFQILPLTEASRAFAEMSRGGHVGKWIFNVGPEPEVLPAFGVAAETSVLITGGLGGLGRAMADWLLDHGNPRVWLMSRGAPDELQKQSLQSLRARGARIDVVAGDVTDARGLATILDRIDAEGPPLRGVIHAAGVLRDRTLDHLEAESTALQLGPKVLGAWNLHRLTRHRPLDFFVLYSSAAALLGSPGQASYAAANAALDGLAEHRRDLGLPATSVQWGAWSEAGMAAEPNVLERLVGLGLRPIEPYRGASTMGRLLQESPSVVGVVPANWSRWAKQMSGAAKLPFFKALTREATDARPHQKAHSAALRTVDDVLELLRNHLAAVLRAPVARIEPTLAIAELGFDSLMTVELRTRLEEAFKTNLSLPVLTRAKSIRALAETIFADVALQSGTPESTSIESSPADEPSIPTQTPAPELEKTPVHAQVLEPAAAAVVEVPVRAEALRQVTTGSVIVSDSEHAFEPFPQTHMQKAYKIGERGDLPLGGISYMYLVEFERDHLDCLQAEKAWNAMIRRHAMLRAVLETGGTVRVMPEVDWYPITVTDLPEETNADAWFEARRAELLRRRFDASSWPLFHLEAHRLGNCVRMYVAIALTVCDGSSVRTLLNEWARTLAGIALPPVPGVSFRDFQLAMERLEQSEAFQKAQTYWMERLDEIPPAPALPLAKTLYHIPPDAARVRYSKTLDPKTWSALRAKAEAAGLTPTVVIGSAFSDVLAAWSESRHFTLNLTWFNRPALHSDLRRVVGEFASTILLDVRHDGPTFMERAQALQAQLFQNIEHHLFPGVLVVGALSRRRGITLMPIVFTSLLGQRAPEDEMAIVADTLGQVVHSATQTPQVLLDHIVMEESNGAVTLTWDVIEEAFPLGMLDAMMNVYADLLQRLATEAQAWTASRMHLLPPDQRAVRERVNSTDAPVNPILLHARCYEQARRVPHKTAVVCQSKKLSYASLVAHADALALQLQSAGARGEPVAVFLPKSVGQSIAVFGILRAGAIVMPLDPDLPVARIAQVLEMSGARIIVVERQTLASALPTTVMRIDIDDIAPVDAESSWVNVIQPDDPAYLIYTSGSTGAPKGVLLAHRGLVNAVDEGIRLLEATPEDVAIGLTGLHHDLSIFDLFGPLSLGGTLVLPDPNRVREPSHWLDLIQHHAISLWVGVPAWLEMFLTYVERSAQSVLKALRASIAGGDWVPPSLYGRLVAQCPGAKLISIGGPTEISIWNIFHRVTEPESDWPSVPYGRPMRNSKYFIFDERLEDRPDWVAGEMWSSGVGLALRYWRDEGRTMDAFRNHPDTGERLYRTGDIGRYRPDGTIEFLGRRDLQVKIRGVRIELGECEAVVSSFPFVRQAVVVVQGAARGSERSLAAYVVPTDEALAATKEASAFKFERRGRRTWPQSPREIALPAFGQTTLEPLVQRTSQRTFLPDAVPLEALAQLLGVLQNQQAPGQPLPKHRYPSGGSLFPVQVYVHARRIEGLAPGSWYYDPDTHRLVELSPGAEISLDWHVPHNRLIARESAFSVFFVAKLEAVEPFYRSYARDFCLLEAGYMGQLLANRAAELDLGLCPIGGIDAEPLTTLLHLDKQSPVIHSFEGGRPDRSRTAAGPMEAFIQVLREFVAARLPAAMVPTRFFVHRSLPLTANGKVDRKRLAELSGAMNHDATAAANHEPLRDGTESRVAAIMASAMGISSVPPAENFFALGATSIQLVEVAATLSRDFGREVPAMALFERPTVRALADWLDGMQQQASTNANNEARKRGQQRRARRGGDRG